MIHILKKEFWGFFNSLAGYVVLLMFVGVMGLFTWVFPQTSIADSGFASLDPLFTLAPYLLMFLIPALSMRSFAEERKQGTIELLLTHPITDWELVLGKFAACWLLALFALLPTLVYCFSVYELGDGNIDTPATIGSYIGMALLAGTFSAIGIMASSFTDNQIVAFLLAVFGCFLLHDGFDFIASVDTWSRYAYSIEQLGIAAHYSAMSKGLLDSRDLLYFLSIMLCTLWGARLSLGSRKWE